MSAVSHSTGGAGVGSSGGLPVAPVRIFGWSMIAVTFAYFIDNYLSVWLGWPGIWSLFAADAEGSTLQALIQLGLYIVGIAGVILAVQRSGDRGLREDAMAMAGITNYIIKVAFWSVVMIGIVDATISFLRVENLLPAVVGDEMATNLGKSRFRGPYVHMPLIAVAFVIAWRAKTLGFQWLALLVVVAELFIVLSRFVFSYEQAFQGDLVRFWYGALFLFASAYTLFEDGHVRVDVVYAGFSRKAKGWVNAFGSLFMGIVLCWTIFIYGMADKSSIINSALLTFEVSQSGFGMYVKFWMAGFLAIFGLAMTVQFCSYILESIADTRGDPGAREKPEAGGH